MALFDLMQAQNPQEFFGGLRNIGEELKANQDPAFAQQLQNRRAMQAENEKAEALRNIMSAPGATREDKISALANLDLGAAKQFSDLTAPPVVKDTRTAAMKEAEFLSNPDVPQEQKDALLQAKKAGSTSINLGSGEFTGQQAAEKKAAIADTQEAVDAIDRIIKRAEESPSDVGALGAVKGAAQTGLEILSDVGVPVPAGFSETVKGFAKSEDGLISGLDPDVEKLITGVARTMQPGGGKLLASSIQRAKDVVGIKGLQGSKQVIEKLKKQREQLINNLESQKQIFSEAGAKTDIGKKAKGTKNPTYNPATGEFE
jgi:hypothetical protein